MHGLMAPLRQFLRLARPWQRVVAGVVLTLVGWLTQIYIIAALGIVLVLLAAAEWVRRRRNDEVEAQPSPPNMTTEAAED